MKAKRKLTWKQSSPLFPLAKGKKVRIFNRTIGGELFVEGVAKLVSKVPDFGRVDHHNWTVRFQGDSTSYRRIIYLEADFAPRELKEALAKENKK